MRLYAQDTEVPISRSRGEIDSLLRQWKCDGIQWSDHFAIDQVVLRFLWSHDGANYMARFTLQLPGREQLKKHAIDGRSGRPSENKMQELLNGRGRREHRCLLLWIKAALNAVELGIVSAEAVFLPFLEDAQGRTVAEVALPRMKELLTGGADRLLPARSK